MNDLYCPNCGASHYSLNYSISTAMGWTQIYKNGVPQNSNPNITTQYNTCYECGHNFTVKYQYGQILNIKDEGAVKPLDHISMDPFTTSSITTSNILNIETDKINIKSSLEERIEKLEEQMKYVLAQKVQT